MKKIVDVATGQIKVCKNDCILRSGAIGSCVVVAAFCRGKTIAALAHIMLPGKAPQNHIDQKNKYAVDAVAEVAEDAVDALGELLKALLHPVAAARIVGRVRDRLGRDDEEAGVARPPEIAADALGGRALLASVPAQVVAQIERIVAPDPEPAGGAARRVVHVHGDAVAPDRVGEEEAGRILRYSFFDEVLDRWNGDRIATGHTKTDSAETIFLNLMRGAGPRGMAGISSRSCHSRSGTRSFSMRTKATSRGSNTRRT